MRLLVKDIIWMFLFAVGMTGVFAVPFGALVAAVVLVDDNMSETATIILIAAGFIFFISIGMLRILKHHHRVNERSAPVRALTGEDTPVEETKIMQALDQRSRAMEKRLESLETILLGHVDQKETTLR